MKKLFKYIITHFDKIYILALFLVSYLIVVFIFPGEGKFKYEYHKGHPWLHKDMAAPYDFAIYKLNDEFEIEKKEALRNFAPIYNKNNKIGKKRVEEFKADFEQSWKNWRIEFDSLKKLNLHKEITDYHKDSVRFYFIKTLKLLEQIYQQGIIDSDDETNSADGKPELIRVINDKIATEVKYSSIFTLKTARDYLIQSMNDNGKNLVLNHNFEFITSLQLTRYLSPNLYYDKLTTEKARTELIDGISVTKGIVNKGDHIVSKGEMIDLDKYRKLESLKREYLSTVKNTSNRLLFILSRFIIAMFGFLIVFLFLKQFRDYVLESRRKTFFILMLIVSFNLLANFVHNMDTVSIYLIPFIIVPILMTTFYETRLALFIHLVTILLAAFYAPNSFEFIFIQFFAGMIAIIGLKRIQKRSQFLIATFLSVCSYFLLYFGFAINQSGDFNNIEWINFAWFAGNGMLVLLSFPMVYIFEKTFNFVSDITLLELSDTNQSLLRELADKAPGTFQHSMQLANVAEEVIRAIGGNHLLVRAGALYHDIGKLSNPQYFTENQVNDINPHDKISYLESAAIILNHVAYGYELAKKEQLPGLIIDFIVSHHGTTKVEYFYRLYKKENPDNPMDEKFTYPGPKPNSKETAVLMMCDVVEAASRSLRQFDMPSIDNLVEKIIDYQIDADQFDNAPISFAEINTAKRIIKNKLNSIYHGRVEYPKV